MADRHITVSRAAYENPDADVFIIRVDDVIIAECPFTNNEIRALAIAAALAYDTAAMTAS